MDENTTTPPNDPAPPMQADPAPPGPAPTMSQPVSFGQGAIADASADERSQAMLMWIIAIFASLIGPLIFFIVAKDKPFVYRHSAMALTWTLVSAVICIILIVTIVGMLLLPLVGIANLVVCILGAMNANNGRYLELPVIPGLTKSIFKV